jgi:hypothetical protein
VLPPDIAKLLPKGRLLSEVRRGPNVPPDPSFHMPSGAQTRRASFQPRPPSLFEKHRVGMGHAALGFAPRARKPRGRSRPPAVTGPRR